MAKLTKAQQQAVLRIYKRDMTVAPSYCSFRRTVVGGFGYVSVLWKGMWLGIEADGYIHS